ncbi:MAG TPA: glycoside hydrolase family 44 protein [Vicinamibacteria bacterium]
MGACGGGGASSPSGPTTPAASPPAPEQDVRLSVDTGSARHPISPYIYGVNQADWSGRSRGVRLGRLGGNRWTAYNWETNASNAGADFRHQNDDFLGGGNTPGEAVRPYVAQAHAAGASVVVTVPMAGYVSADKNGGGDVNQTPDFLNVRFQRTGIKGRGFVYPPDSGDDVVYLDEFVAWLESAFGAARSDPSRTIFYCLDNEPDLWASTHPRIRPTGKLTYDELLARTVTLADAIKRAAPEALVFGPVSYGWAGYVSLQDAPDAGGRDFLDVYLSSLRAAAASARRRLVDVLDLHWYPEARGGGVRVTDPSSVPAVAAARVQAPRSLWDPSYVETSWISQDARVGAIRLIPRMKEKIAASYPGTRLAFTEYNYGGGRDVSGAIAQADVLGIFGREDVFAANVWASDADQTFLHAGLYAFVNYDGAGGRFGDTSVHATTSNHEATSVYASVDAERDDRLVVVAINKSTGAVNAEIAIDHPRALSTGRIFQITAATPALVPGPVPTAPSRNLFRLRLPPSSVTTLVLTP